MDILTDMREGDNRKVVYWPVLKDHLGVPIKNDYGDPQYDTPREIQVFWVDTLQSVNRGNGESFDSKVTVFVGEDIDIFGVLRKCRLTEIPDGMEMTPLQIPRTFQVQMFTKLETLAGDDTLRVAYL